LCFSTSTGAAATHRKSCSISPSPRTGRYDQAMAVSPKGRKRLLIATLIVIGLAGGASWLSRPKVDLRYVGRYKAHDNDRLKRQLNADGYGTTDVASERPITVRWLVTDGQLIVELVPPRSLDALRLKADLIYRLLTGQPRPTLMIGTISLEDWVSKEMELPHERPSLLWVRDHEAETEGTL